MIVVVTFASYLFGLVHEMSTVCVLPAVLGFVDLQSPDCWPRWARLFTSFTISGVKQVVCLCGMPDIAISHSPGRIRGVCADTGAAKASRTAASAAAGSLGVAMRGSGGSEKRRRLSGNRAGCNARL